MGKKELNRWKLETLHKQKTSKEATK